MKALQARFPRSVLLSTEFLAIIEATLLNTCLNWDSVCGMYTRDLKIIKPKNAHVYSTLSNTQVN